MSVVAIDVGSQFVDLARQRDGAIETFKHPLDNDSAATAVLSAILRAVGEFGAEITAIREIRIGSTGAINELLARKRCRIALVATTGFADTLYLGRQNRRDLYKPVASPATPAFLVEPDDIFEVGGRMDAQGAEVTPLCESDLTAILKRLETDPVEAVAICFLHSHLNPTHELRAREIISGRLPNLPIIVSHETDPQPREFERTVSTCLEAWLRPQESQTLGQLKAGLGAHGFAGALTFADGTGRLLSEDRIAVNSTAALVSGPAAAGYHAASVAMSNEETAAISIDIGSTTTDIALIRDGAITHVRQAEIAGVPIRQSMLDIESIEMGGLTHPKPDGIGGVVLQREGKPGSATLSDCLAWHGRLPSQLDPAGVVRIEHLARSAEADQNGVTRLAISEAARTCAAAILRYAVARNVDPSKMSLVAMGGLGGILGTDIADQLGIHRILIPAAPALAGALGMLHMVPNISARNRLGLAASSLDTTTLREHLLKLRSSLPIHVADDTTERLIIEMAATRYMHPFDVIIDGPDENPLTIRSAFREQYRRRFGIHPPGEGYFFAMTLSRLGAGQAPMSVSPTPVKQRQGLLVMDGGSIWIPDTHSLSVCAGGYWLERKPA